MDSVFSKKKQGSTKGLKTNKVDKANKVDKGDKGNKVVSKKQQFTMESMTNRERDVFVLIKKGLTSKECAVVLKISVRTVEVHRANLIQKFQVKNIVELVFRINKEERTKTKTH